MGYKSIDDFLKLDLVRQKDRNYVLDTLTSTISRGDIITIIRNLIAERIHFSLTIFDIDNFKIINDTFGHSEGDRILKMVTEAVTNQIGDEALIGRYGGDEFLVISTAYEYNDVWKFDKGVMEAVRNLKSNLKNFDITITAGSACYPKDAKDIDDLFVKIDKALFRGKQKGRNCFIVYNDALHKNIDMSNKVEQTVDLMDYCHREFMSDDPIKEKIQVANKFVCDLLVLNCYYIDAKTNKIKTIIGEDNLEPMKTNLFEEILDKEDTISINDYSRLISKHPILHEYCWDNKIKSFTLIKVFGPDKNYGYFLYTDKNVKRVWQKNERIILTYISHMIGMLMYYEKKVKK